MQDRGRLFGRVRSLVDLFDPTPYILVAQWVKKLGQSRPWVDGRTLLESDLLG